MAGTTRDSIHIDFEREGKPFTIIDTAGVRRRGKVDEAVEKFSVIKAMQAVEAANVAVLVLDAQQDIADQDATIAGFALEAGRALVGGGQQMGRYQRRAPRASETRYQPQTVFP